MTHSDPTRISDDQHNNAPAVPQGLPAFDDLDDDVIDAACTAGSLLYRVDLMRAYECIRKALAATPAPAPAPAPAQEGGESVQLRGLDDSSAMLRVRTILESKACYLAGSTIAEIVAAAQPAQEALADGVPRGLADAWIHKIEATGATHE